ncbi:hypothetical protein RRG08_003247 [Elysia crispata]|uniref:Uncharacterized protein n=1 Tax=Elysia crispata TaxID=231223 RepID=A0AAE1E6T7_9GAST|nr:hypothetical protein RRG08_003247 [Elysia crispata]
MGIIGTAAPSEKLSGLIRRFTSVSARQTYTRGHISVHFYSSSKTEISLKYEELQDFRIEDIARKLDLFMGSVMASTITSNRLVWTDANSMRGKLSWSEHDHPLAHDRHAAHTHELRIIPPTYKVKPELTFDQPPWWKVQLLVNNEPAEIENYLRYLSLRLVEFHTQMSYLGTI